ncbi:MAG: hypothetical protein KME16_02905 [Scytolyngbya sp. HA4215-MV1]|jgi:predicted PolB exonuclease-like 3'-5' exonuclease|nr:hypothetical protein [Scytolyngbya sp. HA4215-MV1]
MKNQQSFTFDGLKCWWKGIVKKVSPDALTMIGIILFLFVGWSSYFTGRLSLATTDSNNSSATNSAEHNKLLIPFIWSLDLLFISLYLTAISTRIKEDKGKVVKLDAEMDEAETVPQMDIEYLSLMKHSLNNLPNRLNGIHTKIDKMRRDLGEREFKKKLEEKYSDYLARQEAVGGINQGLADENNPLGLLATIRAACDFALEGAPNNQKFEDVFSKCVYAYVRAWLTCSIHYGRSVDNKNSLPIDSIFYQDPYQDPRRKDLYIKAIQNLSERFEHEPVDIFLKTPRSRKIAIKYLGDLIKLIREISPQPISTSYQSPKKQSPLN